MDGKSIVEVTRLAITEGKAGRLVKSILMKAMYQYWVENNIEYVIATGRAPIDMLYDQLLFSDLFPNRGYIPMQHVGNVPHRVMTVCVETLQQRWEAVNHPLIKLVLHTYHPDINIFDPQYTNAMKPLRLISNDQHDRLRA